jgi:hypothetical protein
MLPFPIAADGWLKCLRTPDPQEEGDREHSRTLDYLLGPWKFD